MEGAARPLPMAREAARCASSEACLSGTVLWLSPSSCSVCDVHAGALGPDAISRDSLFDVTAKKICSRDLFTWSASLMTGAAVSHTRCREANDHGNILVLGLGALKHGCFHKDVLFLFLNPLPIFNKALISSLLFLFLKYV